MVTKVSAENKEFMRQALKRGRFQTPDQIVNAGLDLLRRQALLDFIDEGRRQLDEGECTEYSDEELDAFFAELDGIVDGARNWEHMVSRGEFDG